MNQFLRTFSWIFTLPLIAMTASSFALADDKAKAAPAPAEDDIKSVFVVPRENKDTDSIKNGKSESIEIRFHMREARFRGGLYFEAVHHIPGAADVALGGSPLSFKKADGTTETRTGLSYDEYQYSTGLLKKDFDEMYGKWIYARNGASLMATGGTIYMLWGIANYVSKKEILGLSFLAGKAVELYKSKIGFAIMIYPSYMAAKEIYNFYNETQNTGKFIPGWEGWKGHEMAERDWLFRVLSQAYENAKYGTPIDEKQFDIDAGFDRYHAVLSGKKVEMPKTDTEASETAGPPPAINTVPMKKDLKFATGAMDHFFSKYVEENAEDELPSQKIPAK